MSEYLDRKQVIDLYEKYHPRLATCVYEFGQELRQLPIVEERPHGEWIENTRYKRKGKKFLDCSRCHYGENGDIICEVSKLPNFCPNCGADMRKRGEDK